MRREPVQKFPLCPCLPFVFNRAFTQNGYMSTGVQATLTEARGVERDG
jgi:hypothetical protein